MRLIRGLLVGAVLLIALWGLFVHGNPGGVSDAKYSKFERMAPPKLLYSCTRKPTRESFSRQEGECVQSGRAGCEEKVDEWVEAGATTAVDVVSGAGTSTYEKLLQDARHDCAMNVGNLGPGEFKVLEADEN